MGFCIRIGKEETMKKVVIIGGGAAGMLASVIAAEQGAQVLVLEKNEKLGKKLYITGKGRCNVTNACEREALFSAVLRNPKFLYSAFTAFDNHSMMDFLEQSGVRLKVERGNRVFPESDHSSDIIRALEKRMQQAKVSVRLHTEVSEICSSEGKAAGVKLMDGTFLSADAVIVATGGLSYPSTGSTGDGYRFAKSLGLKVTDCRPSLVPLLTKDTYIPRLQGLALKNTGLMVRSGKKVLYKDFGELLFTHCGVTGPMILSASACLGRYLDKETELPAFLDLKPALTEEQLDARILREFDNAPNKQFKNVIGVLFPASLTPVIIDLSKIPEDKQIHDISKAERKSLISLIKAFPFTITGIGEYKEAVITRGGVSVKEIDPSTMEAKQVRGLFFAGEVLDLDAVTGGYNLQIAWSTGYLAGRNAGR